jgi:hypothetical protein
MVSRTRLWCPDPKLMLEPNTCRHFAPQFFQVQRTEKSRPDHEVGKRDEIENERRRRGTKCDFREIICSEFKALKINNKNRPSEIPTSKPGFKGVIFHGK